MHQMRSWEGFGLIEAIVSLVILGVVLVSLMPAFARSLSINTTGQLKTGAVSVAQEVMDELRQDGEGWPASGTEREVDTGQGVYTAKIEHNQYCDGDCLENSRHVALEITHNGQVLYEVETVFTSLDARVQSP